MIEKLIDKWSTPAGIIVVIGVIIWLAQMQNNVERLLERSVVTDTALVTMSENLGEQSVILARTAAILDITVENLNDVIDRIQRNEGNISSNSQHKHNNNGIFP